MTNTTTRPRAVCPDDHEHGATALCYHTHRCGCTPCREAGTAREALRRRQIAYGTYDSGYVPADDARQHALMLQAFGMGPETIAKHAGINVHIVVTLLVGHTHYINGVPGPRHHKPKKQMLRQNSEAILSVRPTLDALAPGTQISALGTRRRLDDLALKGWSQRQLCDHLGMRSSALSRVNVATKVTAKMARRIVALHDELWNQTPVHHTDAARHGSARTILAAKRRGAVPAIAWDDIDNDEKPAKADKPVKVDEDGNPVIDEIAVELACKGIDVSLTSTERRVAVTRLHAMKLSDHAIAARLHFDVQTSLRIRRELKLPANFDHHREQVSA
ncbi:hypothetical protein [Glaciihabitans sp. dw_435]|uniref:hypothetical protein n=1 Tax=Glaciihabitans sp. dw_435 TaxID=2720081 RepID=UPI001BD666F6|nr:hypothetical protein [Glaciihabitans sp. dw_435]